MRWRGYRTLARRGDTTLAGSPFGLHGVYHHGKEVAPGKVFSSGAHCVELLMVAR
jgi:hypothetical protein